MDPYQFGDSRNYKKSEMKVLIFAYNAEKFINSSSVNLMFNITAELEHLQTL